MTGAAVNFGFDEIPSDADDSSACAEAAVEAASVELLDDGPEGDPLSNIPDAPVEVGVADTSLCTTGIEVIEDTVGAVPFDAGEADEGSLVLVLETAAGVTVTAGATDVGAGGSGEVEEVVVSGPGSGVKAIEVVGVGAALEVEMTETTPEVDMEETATCGELPWT